MLLKEISNIQIFSIWTKIIFGNLFNEPIKDFFPETLKRFNSIDRHNIQKCEKSNFEKKIAEELFGCSNLYVRMTCWHLNRIDILTKNIAAGTNELISINFIENWFVQW